MTNNEIIRNLRYTFDFNDSKMIEIFALADRVVTREEVCSWLKKEENPVFVPCEDKDMSSYLDGLIYLKRGKQDKPAPKLEQDLTANIILKKLKIALNLKSDDLMAILSLAKVKISKHELSALFRQKEHKNYRECKDQFLRNFLKGLQIKYRPNH